MRSIFIGLLIGNTYTNTKCNQKKKNIKLISMIHIVVLIKLFLI